MPKVTRPAAPRFASLRSGRVASGLAWIAGIFWLINALSFMGWLLMAVAGLPGCWHAETGGFDCHPDLWYSAGVFYGTGTWIVVFILLISVFDPAGLSGNTGWLLAFAVVVCVGTLVLLGRFAIRLIGACLAR
jgi:hypothetical protein